jgi:hypothetical protein
LEVPNAQANQFYNRCRNNGFGYGFLVPKRFGQDQSRRCSTNPLLGIVDLKSVPDLLIGAWRGTVRPSARAVLYKDVGDLIA